MVVNDRGETNHTLKLGQACYLRTGGVDRKEKRDWQRFTNADDFWQFVLSHCQRKNKLWVIAHNLSFDFTIVDGFRYLKDAGFKCRFFYSASAATLIKVTCKGKSIMFVDFFNWFRESLATIGDRIGVPKLSVDFDNVTEAKLSRYCKRDTEIMVEMFLHLVQFLIDNRVSRLCYTLGSTAMAAFLFRHYGVEIYIHNNSKAIDLERESYKGGRTECFYIGTLSDGPYFVVDVNSLYPFVMQNNQFPVKYDHMATGLSLSELSELLIDRSVVADVMLDTDVAAYAVKRDRTLFPVGKFRTVLTSPELAFAIKYNHIAEIFSVVSFYQSNIFSSYVRRFYKLRNDCKAKDNLLFEHFCKLLLNSLYGKFGQKIEVWKKIGDCPGEPDRIEDIIDTVTHRRRRLRYLLGELSEMTGFTESRHSFPAISSHVTAFARLYMFRLMQVAGKENLFYCDTDSLFVNSAGLEKLKRFMDDTKLGKLKLESQTETLTIYGLKDYIIDTKTVIKGIKKSAIRIAQGEYQQEQWPSLQGLLVRGDVHTYKTHVQRKHLLREYTKGRITPSGWIVPFVLNDEIGQADLPF